MSEIDSVSVASKPIIIAKSIKSLTSSHAPVVPVVAEKVLEKPANEDSALFNTMPAKPMSEQERLELRIKKFGEVTNENTKKDLRAKRFGESVAASGGENGSAAEKKALRAQRFGVAESEAAASGVISPEVLEKRAQRFGIVEEKAANGAGANEALEKRKMRFGSTSEEDVKKKQRAERFENKA